MSEKKENVEKKVVKDVVNYKEPEVMEVHGEILAVDTMTNKDGEDLGIMVSIFDVKTQKTFKAITSEGQLDAFTSNGGKYRDVVKQGSQCTAKLEIHIENETGYTQEGVAKFHKSSGFSLREILPLSSFQSNYFNARNSEQVKIDMEKESLKDRVNSRIEVLTTLGYSREEAIASVKEMMKL